MFYRSARLDNATAGDRDLLTKQYRIKTVVDLRTKSEHIRQSRGNPQGPKNRYVAAAEVATDTDPLISQSEEEHWETRRVNFIGRAFEMNLLRQLRWWQLLWFLLLLLLQFRMAAIRILGRNVLRKKGLQGLSRDSLKFCGAEINETLQIMIRPSSYPLLLHCTQGKDRTGLVTILALLVLSVPPKVIEHDYMLSNDGLKPVRESMMVEVEEIGMDRDYTMAPEGVVGEVRRFLEVEFGGLEEYLDGIGFTVQQREKLRKILLKEV